MDIMAATAYRQPDFNCTEIVHEKGDAREIAAMLNSRLVKGWVLDRIIGHMTPNQSFGGPTQARVVVYYFKKQK